MKRQIRGALVLLGALLLTACTAGGTGIGSGTGQATEPMTEPSVTAGPLVLPGDAGTVTEGARHGLTENGFTLSDLTAADGKRVYVIPVASAADFAAPEAADALWSGVPALRADIYRWRDNGYEPAVYAQLAFVPGDGFHVRMTCFEKDPQYAATEYLGKVWNDSCMEFFADWFRTGSYTNMEVNACGASYQGLGVSMEARDTLDTPLAVSASEAEDRWTVEMHITLDDLGRLYGRDTGEIGSGWLFTGNFYKCGSKTEQPHYGMWNRIENDVANFHLSAYFGYLYVQPDGAEK